MKRVPLDATPVCRQLGRNRSICQGKIWLHWINSLLPCTETFAISIYCHIHEAYISYCCLLKHYPFIVLVNRDRVKNVHMASAMTVSRREIMSMTTDVIRKEFAEIISRLVSVQERDVRTTMFTSCLATVSPDAKKLFELSRRKETLHINHVRRTLDKIQEHRKDRPLHDFSKDDLYFFVTSAVFDYRIECDGLQQLFADETRRHYELESHHEQFESVRDKECDPDDIREMAVDRMSRSIQSNQGSVSEEDMRKYAPNFVRGDKNKKLALFYHYVRSYKDLTEQTYRTLSGLSH